MSEKNRWLHCRLSDADFEKMQVHSEQLEMNPSDYVRYLIRIPVEAAGTGSAEPAIVLDTGTCTRIYNELVRWGHHYNQAVHALNTVQLFVNRGGNNTEYFIEQLDRANRLLSETEKGRKDLTREVRSLQSKTIIGG